MKSRAMACAIYSNGCCQNDWIQYVWCRGAGIDGVYHFDAWSHQESDGLQLLAEWGLLGIFGIEVLEDAAL